MADAPPFDPSQPFEPVTTEAPPFDPTQPFETVEAQPAKSPSWGDVGTQAVKNIPSSAYQFGHDIAQPFLHPIDTATNIANLGRGVLQKTGLSGGNEYEPYADAVGKFLVDRYGSMDAVKHTLANDPVGVAADLSMLLSGGETAAARLPGIAGRVGEVAGTVGRTMDPINLAAQTAKKTGQFATEMVGELGTGTGGESLRLAAKAGFEGGDAAKALRENMRGTAPMEDAVTEARNAVGALRKERGDAYRSGMTGIAADPTVLDFGQIDRAVGDAAAVKSYKGQNLSPKTQAIRDEITGAISDWKALDPAEFHTAEGLDALKQKIGDIRDGSQFGTPERVVADRAYHAIRKTITDQAPQYAKVMKGYEEASKQIKEIENTLAGKPGANVETSLRKLQSVLRNNVSSAYGRRRELADFLAQSGAPNLMYKLAGQSLSSPVSRGLGKLGMQLATELGLMGIGAAVAGAHGAAAALPVLPLMSPRLMGEAAYAAGRGAGHVVRALPSGKTLRVGAEVLRQSGRLPSRPGQEPGLP